MDAVAAFFSGLGSTLAFLAAVFAVALVVERIAPAERGQPFTRLRFNLVLGVLLFTISSALVAVLHPLIVPLISAPIGQRLHLELPDGAAWSVAQVLLFFLV